MADIICGSLSMEQIPISKSEIAQRLKIPPGFRNDVIDKCTLAVSRACAPRYCYIKTPVSFEGEDTVVFEFAKLKSRNLYANLRGCSHAYIMALTLGMDVDRLILRLGAGSKAESFVADALASAAAEAAIDCLNGMLKEGQSLKVRFSPGYGDLDISTQEAVLSYLKADKLIGIKLGDNFMMTPRKSITAVCGISD